MHLVQYPSIGNVSVSRAQDQTEDGVDLSVPDDFRIVFKKLLKKDTVTKCKALQELSALVQTAKRDDVLQALPYWPTVYRKLGQDVDRCVLS